MSSPILFCSDIHLCPETPVRNARFFRWLETLSDVELVIVGDLFHYWWNYATLPEPYAALLEPLQRLSKRGVRLCLVGGNHDFSLPQQLPANAIQLPPELHIEHGDKADQSLGYRTITAVLHSSAFAALMSRLKPRHGFAFLKKLAGDSKRPYVHNELLVSAQRQHGQAQLGRVDWVLQGHSHYLAHERHSNGALVWLGDWVHHCSYARWADGRLELCCWREGGPEQEVVVSVKELGAS